MVEPGTSFMLILTLKACSFTLTKSNSSKKAPLVHQDTAAKSTQACVLWYWQPIDSTFSLQEEGKRQRFSAANHSSHPKATPNSWRVAFSLSPKTECGCSSLGPCPEDFQGESLGGGPISRGTILSVTAVGVWRGGRDAANGKQSGNEEQICRCLEHPRCYRSAKCYYHGQETCCEYPPYSTSFCSAPSTGSASNFPHQPHENRSLWLQPF